jgi:iron complex transport system substrate-binding protein
MITLKTRQLWALVLLIVAIATLSGCAKQKVKQTKTQAIPQRIVSIAPSQTEVLFALGLEDRIVGVTSRCNYPPEAKKKPKIGDMNASLEKIVAQKPDIVFANPTINDAIINRIEGLGIRVYASDPKTFDEVIADIKKIGEVTGAEKRGGEIVGRMQSAVQKAQGTAKSHPRMLVVASASPLYTAGPDTLVDDMVGYLGAENVAYDLQPGRFSQMSAETAISRNPDVIIVSFDSEKAFFRKSTIWRGTSAVRNGKVFVIDPDLIFRPGPRLALGLEEMAKTVSAN